MEVCEAQHTYVVIKMSLEIFILSQAVQTEGSVDEQFRRGRPGADIVMNMRDIPSNSQGA